MVEEKQAESILMLDVREQTSIADYFIIATVDNLRQSRAIEHDLLEELKLEQKIRPLSAEGIGTNNQGWTLLDYGDVILHLFNEEMRAHYDLEGLWEEATVVLKIL